MDRRHSRNQQVEKEAVEGEMTVHPRAWQKGSASRSQAGVSGVGRDCLRSLCTDAGHLKRIR